jgi:hypothetical protein
MNPAKKADSRSMCLVASKVSQRTFKYSFVASCHSLVIVFGGGRANE